MSELPSERLHTGPQERRGYHFWLVFAALCSSALLEALDFTTIGTSLPTIVNDLEGADKYIWVGASYTLSSAAFLPLIASLANVVGRKPCLLGSLFLFAFGSAICGSAQNMAMLISGRTVQGLGAGGIGTLSDIIIADLVPLNERGTFLGIIAAVWALASAVGPTIGGVFSEKVSWRWLFYLNIPLTSVSLAMILFSLKLKRPSGTILHNLSRVDWLGNLIVISGATAVMIALTWGGGAYRWLSYQVLTPLILGSVFIVFFLYYEKRWAQEPSVPFQLLSNMTSLSGYLGTFFHGIVSTTIIYYLPLYFQTVKGHSPEKTGIDLLEISLTIAPIAVVCGVSVGVLNRYRIQNIVGWIITIVGFGLLSLIDADTAGAKLAGYQIMAAIGVGVLFTSVTFPILAPLGVQDNAQALAFFLFIRTFSYTFGIGIGGTILQNELTRRLPPDLLALFRPNEDIAYAALRIIPTVPNDQRQLLRMHFAQSISVIWKVLVGIAGAGLISCVLMKEISMSNEIDERWQIDHGGRTLDPESSATSYRNRYNGMPMSEVDE